LGGRARQFASGRSRAGSRPKDYSGRDPQASQALAAARCHFCSLPLTATGVAAGRRYWCLGELTMKSLTRRSAMAAFWAVAALPAAANNADAELLALNAELDKHWPPAFDAYRRYEETGQAASAELQRLLKGGDEFLSFYALEDENERYKQAFKAAEEKSGI